MTSFVLWNTFRMSCVFSDCAQEKIILSSLFTGFPPFERDFTSPQGCFAFQLSTVPWSPTYCPGKPGVVAVAPSIGKLGGLSCGRKVMARAQAVSQPCGEVWPQTTQQDGGGSAESSPQPCKAGVVIPNNRAEAAARHTQPQLQGKAAPAAL